MRAAKSLGIALRRLGSGGVDALRLVIEDYFALRAARWWARYVEGQLGRLAFCLWLLLVFCVSLAIPRILCWIPKEAIAQRSYSFVVNVNSADWPELTLLPRIGVVLSQRIVADRARHGKFTRPEDLLRVRGIGPKTLKRMQDYITLDLSDPQAVGHGAAD